MVQTTPTAPTAPTALARRPDTAGPLAVATPITETSPRSALSPAASTGSAFGDEEAVRRALEQRNQF